MATFLLDSKSDLARRDRVEAAIANGDLPEPPQGTQKLHECELLGCQTVLRQYVSGHGYCCLSCAEAMSQWQEVLDLVNDIEPAPGYDPTCGMENTDDWARKSAQHIFNDWCWRGCPEELMPQPMRDALFPPSKHGIRFTVDAPQVPQKPASDASPRKPVESWVEERVEQIKAQRGPESVASERRWHEARKAGEARRDEAVRAAAPKAAPILPQALQSNEDVLEAIAMSKLPVPLARIDELVEAVQVAVENWNDLAARILPDSYNLKQSHTGVSVILRHPDHPSCVVVGSADPTTGKMEFVSSRGEIREYMHKVAAGMKPSEHPKLPGVMMQAPIPDDAKRDHIPAALNGDLPLFADVAPGDPKTAS